MKLNILQKIVLFIYGCSFVYFSIIHVPFRKGKYEIEYDTLFSNSSNLETSRLILIIVVLTIITVALFFLFGNINYSYKFNFLSKKRTRTLIYSFIGLILLSIIIYSINNFQTRKKNQETILKESVPFQTQDSTTVVANPEKTIPVPPFVRKKFKCTLENALKDFKSYWELHFPKSKIYGEPVIIEQSDCTYRIKFKTFTPPSSYSIDATIVELSYNDDYSDYSCRVIGAAFD